MTREIRTLDNYEITVSWAAGAEEPSFSGLKYNPRFSITSDAALAIFGKAGVNTPTGLSISSVDSLGKVLYDEGFAPSELPSLNEAVDGSADNIESR